MSSPFARNLTLSYVRSLLTFLSQISHITIFLDYAQSVSAIEIEHILFTAHCL